MFCASIKRISRSIPSEPIPGTSAPPSSFTVRYICRLANSSCAPAVSLRIRMPYWCHCQPSRYWIDDIWNSAIQITFTLST
jgi:hypothetical protein